MFSRYCSKCTMKDHCLEQGKCFIEKLEEKFNIDLLDDQDDNLAEVSDLADGSDLTDEAGYSVFTRAEEEEDEETS